MFAVLCGVWSVEDATRLYLSYFELAQIFLFNMIYFETGKDTARSFMKTSYITSFTISEFAVVAAQPSSSTLIRMGCLRNSGASSVCIAGRGGYHMSTFITSDTKGALSY